jgi:hypothetical protein
MNEALFDMIAAGVPHRDMRARVADADLDRFGISKGYTTAVDAITAVRLRDEFDFESAAEVGIAGRQAIEMACLGKKIGIVDRDPAREVSGSPYLKFANSVTGLFPEEHLGSASACYFTFTTPDGRTSHAFYYGGVDGGDIRLSALAARSARILCVEDRLWDIENGDGFASHAIEAARAAGRATVLLCKDAECIDRNRAAMKAIADASIDVIAGEAQAVLALHHFQRLDSLVPLIRAHGQRAIIWREKHPPLIFSGELLATHSDAGPVTSTEFWTAFLPRRLAAFAESGSLHPFAFPLPQTEFQPDARVDYQGRK